MKKYLAFIGDIHGRWGDLEKVINHLSDKNIVSWFLVGDIGHMFHPIEKYSMPDLFKTNCYAIDGNHDNPYFLKPDSDTTYKLINNVTYVPRGTVLNIEGKIIFLMGGASSIDRHFRKPMVDWWQEEEITYRQYDRALNAIKNKNIDIAVTHDAPMSFELDGIEPYPHLCGPRKALESLKNEINPKHWFFGHYHLSCSGTQEGISWHCLNKIHDIEDISESYYLLEI